MNTEEKYKEILLNLKDGESWIWPESDYGRAEIYKCNNIYVLFEIPTYGGKPMFSDVYSLETLDAMIEMVSGWT